MLLEDQYSKWLKVELLFENISSMFIVSPWFCTQPPMALETLLWNIEGSRKDGLKNYLSVISKLISSIRKRWSLSPTFLLLIDLPHPFSLAPVPQPNQGRRRCHPGLIRGIDCAMFISIDYTSGSVTRPCWTHNPVLSCARFCLGFS